MRSRLLRSGRLDHCLELKGQVEFGLHREDGVHQRPLGAQTTRRSKELTHDRWPSAHSRSCQLHLDPARSVQ